MKRIVVVTLLVLLGLGVVALGGIGYWLSQPKVVGFQVPTQVSVPSSITLQHHAYAQLLQAIETGDVEAVVTLNPGQYMLKHQEQAYWLTVQDGTTLEASLGFTASSQAAEARWDIARGRLQFSQPVRIAHPDGWTGKLIQASLRPEDGAVDVQLQLVTSETLSKLLVRSLYETGSQEQSDSRPIDLFQSIHVSSARFELREQAPLEWGDSRLLIGADSSLRFIGFDFKQLQGERDITGELQADLKLADGSRFQWRNAVLETNAGVLLTRLRFHNAAGVISLRQQPDHSTECRLSGLTVRFTNLPHEFQLSEGSVLLDRFQFESVPGQPLPALALKFAGQLSDGRAAFQWHRGPLSIEQIEVPGVEAELTLAANREPTFEMTFPQGITLKKLDWQRRSERAGELLVQVAETSLPALTLRDWEQVQIGADTLFRAPGEVTYTHPAGHVLQLWTDEQTRLQFTGEARLRPEELRSRRLEKIVPRFRLAGAVPRCQLTFAPVQRSVTAKSIQVDLAFDLSEQLEMHGSLSGRVQSENLLPGLRGEQSVAVDRLQLDQDEEGGQWLTLQGVELKLPRQTVLDALKSAIPRKVPLPDVAVNRNVGVLRVTELTGLELAGLQPRSLNVKNDTATFSVTPQLTGEVIRQELRITSTDRQVGRNPLTGKPITLPIPKRYWKTMPGSPFAIEFQIAGQAQVLLSQADTLAEQAVLVDVTCDKARLTDTRLEQFPLAGDLAPFLPDVQDYVQIEGQSLPDNMKSRLTRTVRISPWGQFGEQQRKLLGQCQPVQFRLISDKENFRLAGDIRLRLNGPTE